MGTVSRLRSRYWGILAILLLLTLLLPALPAIPAQAAPVLAVNVNGVVTTDPAPGGNANGVVEPGETIRVVVTLQNSGDATATNVQGTLSTVTPGVMIPTPTVAFPDIAASGTGSNATPLVFQLSRTYDCGAPVAFVLNVSFTGGGPTALPFNVNTAQPGTATTFSYTGPTVPIPDSSGTNTPGILAAASLPVMQAGRVGKVVVSIDGTTCTATAGATTVGIDHTFVNDLEIMLQSPTGTNVVIINRTDGGGNNFCQTVLDDDSAGPSIQSVATAQAPFTGSFTPNSPLAAFKGETISGTWQLQAQDFFVGDTGNIRAWSLQVQPAVCAAAPAPTGNSDAYVTPANTALTIAAPGVLGNDISPSGAPLTASQVAAPAHGALTTFNADGSFVYTPTPGYVGPDSFTYTANDGTLTSTTTTVSLTVSPPIPVTTTTTVTAATAPFSAAAQPVTLTAQVASSVPVNEGTVTFTVKQVGTTIGVPVTSGTVANGVATAVFSLPAGTPVGAYSVTAVYTPIAMNPSFLTSTGSGTLTVSAATLTLAPTTLPTGTAGIAYAQTVTATGGNGTYTYTATGLPANLTINASTGAITGTPAAAGMSSVTVSVSDTAGNAGSRMYTLTVGTSTIALTTPTGNGSGNGGTATMPVIRAGTSTALFTQLNGMPLLVGVTYTSSNPNVVSVDPTTGVVTGISGGTTTITASGPNGAMGTIVVTVTGGTGSGLMAPAPQPGVKANGTAAPAAATPAPHRRARQTRARQGGSRRREWGNPPPRRSPGPPAANRHRTPHTHTRAGE